MELNAIKRSKATVEEIATYLNLSKDTIYKLVREKKIPCVRIGSRIIFDLASVEKWFNQLEQESVE